MNEHSSVPSTEATPLRADLFTSLIRQLVGEIATTENFQTTLSGYLESRLDSMADDLASDMCSSIVENIDLDDIIQNSGALTSLEDKLGEKLVEVVEDINI